MNTDLIDKLFPAFNNLLQRYGFKKVEEIYKPEEFGNALIKMESSDFQLRFLRDKGQSFVDISPLGTDRWYQLQYVLEFVDSNIRPDDFGSPPKIDKLSESLDKNYYKVRNLFLDTAALSNFENFAENKMKEFINRIFRTD
jgi:hypothetical protein